MGAKEAQREGFGANKGRGGGGGGGVANEAHGGVLALTRRPRGGWWH